MEPYAIKFEQQTMFRKGSFCKLFMLESPKQSGELLHSHDYYQIWYVVRGKSIHQIEGTSHTISAGEAFILPPNLNHLTLLADNTKVLCCEFSMNDVRWDAANLSFQKINEITDGISFMFLFQNELQSAQTKFTLSTGTQQKIETLMLQMLDEYQRAEFLYEDILQVQLFHLLLLFIREYAQHPISRPTKELYARYQDIVKDVVKYIEQHYNEPLTLDDVCKYATMSKTYFCYLFKMQTQKTFVEYLVNLRVEKAMELLRTTDRSITDISQDVGFQASTHFTRTFRKIVGISPREYRSSYRK